MVFLALALFFVGNMNFRVSKAALIAYTVTAGEDSWVGASFPDTNFGSYTLLQVIGGPGFFGQPSRAWLKFQVPTNIFPGSNAILSLYNNGTAGGWPMVIGVHKSADTSWSEGSITWNNQPSYGASIASATITDGNRWINVTLPYSILTAGANLSLCIETQTSDTLVNFNSKELSSNKPRLYINGVTGSSDIFTAVDTSGNGNDGVVHAGSIGTGKYGNGLYLDNEYFSRDGLAQPFSSIVKPNAIRYGDKTYVVFQGENLDPYIKFYDHASEEWSESVAVGTNPLTADSHGAPSLVINQTGFLMVFFGSHVSGTEFVRSTSAEDITSWTAQTTVMQNSTYPNPVLLSNGTIMVFYRNTTTGSTHGTEVYSTSADGNGASWSNPTKIVDFGAGTFPYQGNFEYNSTNNVIHFTWTVYNYSTNHRESVYHAYMNLTDSLLYSENGTNLGDVIDATEGKGYCMVYEHLFGIFQPAVHAYDNIPYIIYLSRTWVGVTESNPSGIEDYYEFTKWNGTGWDQPTNITQSTGYFYNSNDFIIQNASSIEAYLVGGSVMNDPADWETVLGHGGDLEKWNFNGSTWTKTSTVLNKTRYGVALNSPTIVLNCTGDLKVVFCDHFPDVQTGTVNSYNTLLRIFAYGDSGFIDLPSYMEIPNSDSLTNLRQFTITMWLYIPNALTHEDTIIRKGTTGYDYSFNFIYNSGDDRLHFYVYSEDTSQWKAVSSTFSLATWQYWAITYNSSNLTLKIYRNSALMESATFSNPGNLSYTTASILVGSNRLKTQLTPLRIDELRIYNVPLGLKEISDIQKSSHISDFRLLGEWKFGGYEASESIIDAYFNIGLGLAGLGLMVGSPIFAVATLKKKGFEGVERAALLGVLTLIGFGLTVIWLW